MQEAVKVMRAQGRGHIVNVGSLAGRRGFSPLGGYSATKFALVGLTEALRTELVGERIHVSLVLPGSSTRRWRLRYSTTRPPATSGPTRSRCRPRG